MITAWLHVLQMFLWQLDPVPSLLNWSVARETRFGCEPQPILKLWSTFDHRSYLSKPTACHIVCIVGA